MNRNLTKIAMIVFSYYPSDPRVRREAEALSEKGYVVDVICLKNESEKSVDNVNGVNVFRINIRRTRGNRFKYIEEYMKFFILSFYKLTFLYFKNKYKVVQVHNMPDFLVFTAVVPKLLGSKVLLDLHDPTPEVYVTKYDKDHKRSLIKFLILLEKYSIRFADYVITPNLAFVDLFIGRGCPSEKIAIVMNSPQEEIFNEKLYKKRNPIVRDYFIVMYHGTIVKRHGLDTALKAIKLLRKRIPNIKFKVYGEGDYVDEFMRLKTNLSLDGVVEYYGFVSQESVAEAIADINVGVIPNKLSCFTNLNFPTRIFEYLCMGKPVIAPRTMGIMDYFKNDELAFFKDNDPESLAKVLFKVYGNKKYATEVCRKGYAIYSEYAWLKQSKVYIDIIRKLSN